MKKRKLPLWAVLLWLLVWQAASMALDSDILLVSPLRVIATLLALLPTARFWASLLGSMARILGGFFLAAALGTLLAALAARFKRVEEWLAPPVLAMKTVPVASFVILALIWFWQLVEEAVLILLKQLRSQQQNREQIWKNSGVVKFQLRRHFRLELYLRLRQQEVR